MYALAAPRSLISYRDLRANGIHAFIQGERDDEMVLELRKRAQFLATVQESATGLYEVLILDGAISPTPQPKKFSGFKFQKVLYGLKRAGRAWYHHL